MAKKQTLGGVIGFIGGGRMAEALISGILKAGFAKPSNVVVCDPDPARREALSSLGIAFSETNIEIVERAATVVLAVKPNIVAKALSGLGKAVGAEKLVISIAAGMKTASIEAMLCPEARVVRVMPNTPCLVGECAAGFAPGANATEQDCKLVEEMFRTVGICFRLDEKLLDAVTGLSGSGPAYVFTMIEAMADGGVLMGLPRNVAQALAAQTVLGAAKMVLEGKTHPGQLRDAVTSPGGTTAEGLLVLEKAGVRAAFAEAVRAATLKSAQLGK
ncbi:MAG TPA: pyrroline-5-carboxylate reductase [Candidatus Brocadiia bacterium]|nr:pyrroline-5-carboxylate reductase [Candidatus Brocadiia bacterium]